MSRSCLRKLLVVAEYNAAFVFKDVSAQICRNCGEDYLDDEVAGSLLKSADTMVAAGTQVEIRRYPATV